MESRVLSRVQTVQPPAMEGPRILWVGHGRSYRLSLNSRTAHKFNQKGPDLTCSATGRQLSNSFNARSSPPIALCPIIKDHDMQAKTRLPRSRSCPSNDHPRDTSWNQGHIHFSSADPRLPFRVFQVTAGGMPWTLSCLVFLGRHMHCSPWTGEELDTKETYDKKA